MSTSGAVTAAAAAAAVALVWGGRKLLDVVRGPTGTMPALDDTRHGGLLVAEVLSKAGVHHVFTLCGGHISPVLVACEAAGISVVDVRHEQTAAFAADAMARLTGLGVVCVTAGPGVLNTVCALQTARMSGANSAVVLLGGAAATLLTGRGALQDVNQIPVLAPLCKYVGRAERVADIPSVLVSAIEAAQEGVPGPVYVELPIDVLYDMGTVHKEITGNRRPPRNLKDRFMAWYMNRYLRRVFAGSFDQLGRLAGPKTRVRPAPSASAIAATLRALQRAQRPVMIVGAAAAVDCEHIDATSAAVRNMGVPTFLSGAARGLAGRECAHAFRQKRSDAVRESDCVLLVGVLTDFRLNYGKGLPKNTIAVNLREKDVKLNQGLFWSAALNVVCDPGVFLRALADALPSGTSSAWSAWVGKLQEREQEVEAANAKRSSEPTTEAHTLNAVFVAQEIERQLADNATLIADGGDFVATLAYVLRPRRPLGWIDAGAFGTLGTGAGYCMAAKLARPSSETWLLYGDGASGFSIMDVDSMVRQKLGVIIVIGNDGQWMQIGRDQIPRFKTDVAVKLGRSRYDQVAEALGGLGRVVSEPSELAPAVAWAKEMAAQNRVVVLNVMIGELATSFRAGSISV